MEQRTRITPGIPSLTEDHNGNSLRVPPAIHQFIFGSSGINRGSTAGRSRWRIAFRAAFCNSSQTPCGVAITSARIDLCAQLPGPLRQFRFKLRA